MGGFMPRREGSSNANIPLDGELNPHNRASQLARESWYKIAAILMMKFDKTAVEITEEDVKKLGDNTNCIVADTRGGKFFVRLVSMEEGERLAREQGGIPV
jgi:hypothetical protein